MSETLNTPKKTKVLFVCLGNICRSPAAEGLFIDLLERKKLSDHFEVDSAGTGDWHIGELPDPRMRDHCMKRGLKLTSKARQFDPEKDFEDFDYILAMDKKNLEDLKALDSEEAFQEKTVLMCQYKQRTKHKEVPDPYFGGPEGFDLVLDILEDSTEGFLNKLNHKLNLF